MPKGTFIGTDRRNNWKIRPEDGGRTVIITGTAGLPRPSGLIEYTPTRSGDYVDFGSYVPPVPEYFRDFGQEDIQTAQMLATSFWGDEELAARLIRVLKGQGDLTYEREQFGGFSYRFAGRIRFIQGEREVLEYSNLGDATSFSFSDGMRIHRVHRLEDAIAGLSPFPYERIGGIRTIGEGFGGKGEGALFLKGRAENLEFIIGDQVLIGASEEKAYLAHNDIRAGSWEDVRSGSMPDGMMDRILAAVDGMRYPLVVRSSTDLEGRHGVSGAGIFESVFITGPEQMEDAIKEVYASRHSPRAIEYLRKNGIDPASVHMGIQLIELITDDYLGDSAIFHGGRAPFASGTVLSRMPFERDKAQVLAAYGLGTLGITGRESVSSQKVPLREGYEAFRVMDEFVQNHKQSILHLVDPTTGDVISRSPASGMENVLAEIPVHHLVSIAWHMERALGYPVIMEYAITHHNFRPTIAILQVERLFMQDLKPVEMPEYSGDEIVLQSNNTMGHGVAKLSDIIVVPDYRGMSKEDFLAMHDKLHELNSKYGGYALLYSGRLGSAINPSERRIVDYDSVSNAGVIVELLPSDQATNCSHLDRILTEQQVLYLSSPRVALESLVSRFPFERYSFGGRDLLVIHAAGSVSARVDSQMQGGGYGVIAVES